MSKAVRIAGWGLLALVVIAVVAVAGLRTYLMSAGARELAAEKLSARLGGRVVVSELSAGLTGGTSLVVEIPAGPGAAPLLTGTVVADVSALGLAAGESPTAVTVEDAKLTLRFDSAGNLIDKMPEPKAGGGGPVPAVTVKRASIRLLQDGRPEFQVSGVDATLAPDGDRFTLAGTADDPGWGKWTLAGDVAADGSTGDAKLTTTGVTKLGMAQLRSLPVVTPKAWEAVQLDGETTGTIRVGKPAGGEWGYRIDLQPRHTTLTLPPVGLVVTDASAAVDIQGMVVKVTGLKGKSAGGDVTADAVGDFGPDPEVITVKAGVVGADVTKLPRKWTAKLPKLDEGRLRAAAELRLRIVGDGVETSGRGTGVVHGKLLGGTVELDVELVGDGGSLEFRQPEQSPQKP